MKQTILSVIILLSFEISKALETSTVLPRGVRRIRLLIVNTEGIDRKFNNSGELESNTKALNQSLSAQDLAQQNPALDLLVKTLNGAKPGLGNSLLNIDLSANSVLNVQQYTPVFEWGVSDKVTLGVKAPIVHRQLRTSFNVTTINRANEVDQMVGKLDPRLSAGLKSLGTKNFDAAYFEQALFVSNGYVAPGDFENTALGDVEFGGKYRFFEKGSTSSALTVLLKAPTGQTPALNNIADTGTGDGTWALMTQVSNDMRLSKLVNIGAAIGSTVYLADTRERAIPKDERDALPSLLPEDGQVARTTRTQPVLLFTEVSSTFNFDESFYTSMAFQYSQKNKSRFNGSKNLYYEGLGNGTDLQKQAVEATATYSTISDFKNNKFDVPMEVGLVYNTVIGGKNVNKVSYGRVDLHVYF